MCTLRLKAGPAWARRLRRWYWHQRLSAYLNAGYLVVLCGPIGKGKAHLAERLAPDVFISGRTGGIPGQYYRLRLSQLPKTGTIALDEITTFEPQALRLWIELVAQQGRGCVVTTQNLTHRTVLETMDCWDISRIRIFQLR